MSPVGALGLFYSAGSLEHRAWPFQHGLWSTGLGLFSMVSGALGFVFSAGLVHSCSPLVGCIQWWLGAANLKSGDFWYGPELAVVISVYGVTIVI